MSNLTFGVEIECGVKATAFRAAGWQHGAYHRGATIPQSPTSSHDGKQWNCQSDGSVHFDGDVTPIEVVSPILRGTEGIAAIRTMAVTLQSMGGKVNQSCGFHVHVGNPELPFTPEQVRRIAALVSRFETGLYAATGLYSRQRNTYAQPIKSQFRDAFHAGRALQTSNRYHTLNLCPLTSRGTVEFRVFTGTLNPTKMVAWVLLVVGIVERALSNAPAVEWDLPQVNSSLARRSPGRTQVEMLMRTLGWTQEASSTRRRFGMTLVGTGKDDLMPFVAELRRLAKKFDAGAPGASGVRGARGPARRRQPAVAPVATPATTQGAHAQNVVNDLASAFEVLGVSR